MSDLAVRFVSDGYMLAPGPLFFEEPFYSFCVDEIAEYAPESIAAAILSLPGAKELHPPRPSWWEWEAAWEEGDRLIILDDNQLFEDTGFWAGVILKCDCRLGDLIALWEAVRTGHPAVWLYGDDCRVYTPESFLAEWSAPRRPEGGR
jgi:hypothetical protein